MAYIAVVENEGEEMVELPLEEDGTLSLGTLSCQFPGACGLKYRSPETGAWRGLRVTNGVVSQLNNDWSGNHCYVVVYPKVSHTRAWPRGPAAANRGEGREISVRVFVAGTRPISHRVGRSVGRSLFF